MSDFVFFFETLSVANKQDPFPGPGSVYVKNRSYFGFEAFDISRAFQGMYEQNRHFAQDQQQQSGTRDTLSKRQ